MYVCLHGFEADGYEFNVQLRVIKYVESEIEAHYWPIINLLLFCLTISVMFGNETNNKI